MFDADGSGTIDILELKDIFHQVNVDENVWLKLMQEVDDNSDGQISFDEFQEMLMKIG